jgi:hypothetical protein
MVISSPTYIALRTSTRGNGGENGNQSWEREEGEGLTDLGRRPRNTILVRVHAVDNQLSTTTAVVDRILKNLDATGGLHDNIEAVGVLLLDLLELGGGILSGKGDIDIGRVKGLGEIHFKTFRCSNDNVASAILAEHLREHLGIGVSLGGSLWQRYNVQDL